MARRKSSHAGFSFPLKAVQVKNLAGLCVLVRSAKGTITHFPDFLRSCTLPNRPSGRGKRERPCKNRPNEIGGEIDLLTIHTIIARRIKSSRLKDLNKNPWLTCSFFHRRHLENICKTRRDRFRYVEEEFFDEISFWIEFFLWISSSFSSVSQQSTFFEENKPCIIRIVSPQLFLYLISLGSYLLTFFTRWICAIYLLISGSNAKRRIVLKNRIDRIQYPF